jgi:23S rRNA A1618 N6-methylase RlmF
VSFFFVSRLPNQLAFHFLTGTGASMIYPLIGVALNPQWTFVATDTHPDSITHAQKLIVRNRIQNQIDLRQVDGTSVLLQGVKDNEKSVPKQKSFDTRV